MFLHKLCYVNIRIGISHVDIPVGIGTILPEFAYPWVHWVVEILALLSLVVIVWDVQHLHLYLNR